MYWNWDCSISSRSTGIYYFVVDFTDFVIITICFFARESKLFSCFFSAENAFKLKMTTRVIISLYITFIPLISLTKTVDF